MPFRLRRSSSLCLVLLALVAPAAAATVGLDLGGLAGGYSQTVPNSDRRGNQLMSTNTLDIVPTGPKSAFVRANLEFYNGHQCYLAGVAHVERDALVYREIDEGLQHCVLEIRRSGDRIELSDENSCQDMCGAYGGFQGASFKASSRLPVTDLTDLKASEEYVGALERDRASGAGR